MTITQIEKKIASLVKIIERYNARLEALYKKYETKDLYLDRDCMCIPCEITPFEITLQAHNVLIVRYYLDENETKFHIRPELNEDGIWYLEDEEFIEELEYNRNRIKSAERFYQSENPDKYLDSDADEDE